MFRALHSHNSFITNAQTPLMDHHDASASVSASDSASASSWRIYYVLYHMNYMIYDRYAMMWPKLDLGQNLRQKTKVRQRYHDGPLWEFARW